MDLFDAAVAAAAPGPTTARAVGSLKLAREPRVWLYAFGKAARPMSQAAVNVLLGARHTIAGGVVVAADDGPPPSPTLVSLRGDHPVPGRHSFAAAAAIGAATSGRRGADIAIVLISGGTSSLIGAPLRGMNEGDFVGLYEMLQGAGLDIEAMNKVRKRFSRWAAGRLALALAPATTYCFAISDVAGDDLSTIGSGPCSPDATTAREIVSILGHANLTSRVPQTFREYLDGVVRGTIAETPTAAHPAFAHVTARVIGNNHMAVDGAGATARERGLEPRVIQERLGGEAAPAGERIARALIAARTEAEHGCVVWGGETTVTVSPSAHRNQSGSGGGRCQELALAAARVLHESGDASSGLTLLAAGTDGRDGATDAAGAIVDVTTWETITNAGRDPAHALAAHESNGALRAAGALIPRRDTGTNVNDVVIGVW